MMLVGLVCGALVLGGCGLRRHAAEAAAVQLNVRYDQIEARLESLQPLTARTWQFRLTQLDRELTHGDPARALALATALQDSLTRLEGELHEVEIVLDEQWSALATSTPPLLERLERDPDARVRREAAHLTKSWRTALEVHEEGRLHEAVDRARAVHSQAIPLVAGTR
ncbi:MAG: hypothetical protein U0704_06405 [Candidatus Eisenbacteria bacterium]